MLDRNYPDKQIYYNIFLSMRSSDAETKQSAAAQF